MPIAPPTPFSTPNYGTATYTSISVDLTPENDPSPAGIFWACQFGFDAGTGAGYMGLQTLGTGLPGKAVVFSIADAISGTGPGIVTNEFDGDPGVSTRTTYNWVPGRTYRLTLTRGINDGTGRLWSVTVTDQTTSVTTNVATIKVPSAWGDLTSLAICWTELYTTPPETCAGLPFARATWTNFTATPALGGPAVTASSWTNTFATSTCTNRSTTNIANGVRQQMGGGVEFTGVIERRRDPQLAEVPSDRIITLSGRGWASELDRAIVYPRGGIDFRPTSTARYFNFATPELNRSAWTTPENVGAVLTADIDVSGSPCPPPALGKTGAAPKGWPDELAHWYWSEAVGGGNSHPLGKVYWHRSITLAAARTVNVLYAGDDNITAWVNGVPVDRTSGPSVTWTTTRGYSVNVTAGTHHFAWEVENTSYLEAGGRFNVGAFCCSAYQETSTSPWFVPGNLLFRTSSTPASAGFTCLGYPGSPPGFTATHALRLLFNECQAAGMVPSWTLDFTDAAFTGGALADTTDELVARVGDSLLDVLKAWHSAGHIDWAVSPSTRTLRVWAHGSRPGGSATVTTSNVRGVTVEDRAT